MCIKDVACLFGKLPGLLLLGNVRPLGWLAKARLATFGRQMGRNDKVVFQGVPSVAKLLLEIGDKFMAEPICSGSLLGKQVSIVVAHPPKVVIARVDGRFVGKVGLHPNRFKETMPCLQSGCPGTIDGMPEEAIGRWAMPGTFIKT